MAMRGYNATTVRAGEPLTAQAWNDVVEALGDVYAELNSRRSASVHITNPGLDLRLVRVVARHASFTPIEAIRPSGDATLHVLAGIRPGDWTVQIEADGFVPEQLALAVPEEGEAAPLEVALRPAGVPMPRVFGLPFRDALATLEAAGIAPSQTFDITGTAYVLDEARRELGDSPVLVQLPAPGVLITQSTPVGLVVGAALESQPSVVMPSLVGMTLDEARRTLEALGLVIGRSDRRTPQIGRVPINDPA